MKKIAMIAMLFGFVGAVHAAPQEATSQGGIGYQASVEPETMLAYDDSQQSDPWIGEGGAMLKPESEYDINLNTDPLCDTDPYSCFHLADNDATTIRTEETQTAFYFVAILCALYCGK